MDLAKLIGTLQHPDPNFRLMTARVLGMVEEVSALEKIGVAAFAENDPEVRETMQWAGKRLTDAKQRGYSVLEDIFTTFHIQHELESLPDPNEQKLVQQMQDNLERDLLASKEKSARGTMGMSVVAGAALGGIAGAAMGAMGAMASSSLSSPLIDTTDPTRKRHPAVIPTTNDFRIPLRRFQQATDVNAKANDLREIRDMNNPEALPLFATLYLRDPELMIQKVAYQCGRELYLRVRYWQLQKDGTIDEEYKRRAEALGKTVAHTDLMNRDKPTATRDATPEEIAEILKRAEEKRASRKKR